MRLTLDYLIARSQHALSRKMKSKGGDPRDHWLDYAADRFDDQLIADVKQVLRVLVLYLPIPVFWALFDQQVHPVQSNISIHFYIQSHCNNGQGSRWTFQATRMDGTLGATTILPDQLQIVNPLFILALVPIFEAFVYPVFTKCGLLTPLQRIGVGGLLAALAFVVSGVVELNLEPTYAQIPQQGLTQLNFINTLPCQVSISYATAGGIDEAHFITVNATSNSIQRNLDSEKAIQVRASASAQSCGDVQFQSTAHSEWSGLLQGSSQKVFFLLHFSPKFMCILRAQLMD